MIIYVTAIKLNVKRSMLTLDDHILDIILVDLILYIILTIFVFEWRFGLNPFNPHKAGFKSINQVPGYALLTPSLTSLAL